METDSAENAERISRRLEVSRLFGGIGTYYNLQIFRFTIPRGTVEYLLFVYAYFIIKCSDVSL